MVIFWSSGTLENVFFQEYETAEKRFKAKMKAEQAKAVELHEEKKLERFVEKRGGEVESRSSAERGSKAESNVTEHT